ncbi:unnamed protein product [Urochloa humidicola]
MSAERKEREAILKTYWDEQRRTARERVLDFAELAEAKRKHGYHPALPPLEILNFPGFGLGRCRCWRRSQEGVVWEGCLRRKSARRRR